MRRFTHPLFNRNPTLITPAYTTTSIWRNRSTFLTGHTAIHSFLTQKWQRELNYRLRKELFAFSSHKIAVQFWYEYQDADEAGDDEKGGGRKWRRCYGLEDWTFDDEGKMRKRMMSGNDVEIEEEQRWFVDGVDVDDESVTRKMTEEHW